MDALQAAISPNRLDQTIFKALADKHQSISEIRYQSFFLHFMYSESPSDAEGIVCDFFYSEDRAYEYYLGGFTSALAAAELPIPSTSANSNVGTPTATLNQTKSKNKETTVGRLTTLKRKWWRW